MAEARDSEEPMSRTQVFLRRDQLDRLDEVARRRGVSRSELLREQIDVLLAHDSDDLNQWREAVRRTAGLLADDPEFEQRMEEIRQDWSEREKRLWGDG